MIEYESISKMPDGYKNKLWPSLINNNYEFTSKPCTTYNCVAWAIHLNDRSIDLSLDDEGEPLVYPDLSCLLYVEYFEQQGFELCDSPEWENGFEKIALYERKGETFEHVARQIGENLWASKLGEWEDIEHTNLEALQSTNFYGYPTWFMKRKI